MCIIERNVIIYPNGHREPHQRLRHCLRGTPNTPCNQTEVFDLPPEYAPPPEAPLAPQYQVVEPRAARRQPQVETVRYRKKAPEGLKAVWDIHIPFTSWNKKSKPKERELIVVKKVRNHRHNPLPPVIHSPPPPPPPPPQPPMEPIPPPPHRPNGPYRGRPRVEERFPRPIEPIEPIELVEERERRGIIERIAREEQERRVRAEREVENLRRQRDHEKRRKNDLKRDKRQLEEERRECEVAAERERRRNAEERRHAESRERANRRAAEARGRANAELEERARRRAEVRRQQEEEEERAVRERIRREAEVAARMYDEETERLARLRLQRIPRGPRHELAVHQYDPGNFEDRGARFINDAIIAREAREAREAEANRGWLRRRYIGGGVRRRDQVAVGERRIYEDDLGRVGGRFR